MNYTEYMNLRKPEEDDFYSVEDINENAEKIDKKIKETDQQMKKNVEKTDAAVMKVEQSAEKVDAATKKAEQSAEAAETAAKKVENLEAVMLYNTVMPIWNVLADELSVSPINGYVWGTSGGTSIMIPATGGGQCVGIDVTPGDVYWVRTYIETDGNVGIWLFY